MGFGLYGAGLLLAFEAGIMVHWMDDYAWCLDTEGLLVALSNNTVKVLQTLAVLH
jgi:hypothetical protein